MNSSSQKHFLLLSLIVGAIGLPALPANAQLRSPDGGAVSSASKKNAEDPKAEETLTMSVFEVQGTADQGYRARSSTAGVKTNMLIENTPQSIQVITNDMINDVKEYHVGVGSILRYGAPGIVAYAQQDAYISRGSRNSGNLVDGTPDLLSSGYLDEAGTDSIAVLKGPAAVLYANSAVSGTINKTSKKPLNTRQESFDFTLGSGKFYRAQADLTGPAGKIGNVRVNYRLIVAGQKSEGFIKPQDEDNRFVFLPALELRLNNTTVRVHYDYMNIHRNNYAGSFLHVGPDGYTDGPWEGAGRYQSFRAPWEEHPFIINRGRIILLQRFSDNWEMSLTGSWNRNSRADDEARFSGNPNQTLGTATMFELRDDIVYTNHFVSNDFNGKYKLFGIDQISTMGWNFQNAVGDAVYRTKTLGVVSLYTPNALAAFSRTPLANFDGNLIDPARSTLRWFDAYYMQTASFLKERAIVVGGISYQSVENLTQNRLRLTNTVGPNGHDEPYRLGAIFKPVKGASLYINRATTFAPQTNRKFNGDLVGNTTATVTEYGVRYDLFDGKIAGTVDYFEQEQTNLATLDNVNQAGVFYTGNGITSNKGWEADMYIEPTPHWSTVLTYYSGDLINKLTGDRIADALNHTASVMSKYTFSNGTFKGLSVGANYFRQGRRWNTRANGYGFPGYDLYNAFVTYRRNSWNVSVHVKNLQDKYYVDTGFVALAWVEIAPPRQIFLSYSMTFK